MKNSNVLLVTFVVLTLIFASASLYEYTRVGDLSSKLQASSQTSQVPEILREKGSIEIGSLGSFAYAKANASATNGYTSAAFSFRNVSFVPVTDKTITGAACADYEIGFQDGTSEELLACSYPTGFPTAIVFTKHASPQAGLIYSPSGLLYFLVSE